MDRSQLTYGVKADMHKWSYEAMNEFYKKYPPLYNDIAQVAPVTKVAGEFYLETTAMGIDDIPERVENAGIEEAQFTEGFSPMIAVRNRAVKIPITHEAKRDFTKAANFLEKSVKDNLPELYVNVVNKIVTNMFNYGSVTSGNAVFNQSTKNQADASGNMIYDSAEFMSISGTSTAHTNKSGTTYNNGLAAAEPTYTNLNTADILLCSTNAKREDDQPFDNTTGLKAMVHPYYKSRMMMTLKSELTPDDANTAINPHKDGYGMIINPYLTTTTSWAIGRAGFGIKLFLGKPRYSFWYDEDTMEYKASINFDYGCGPTNFRFVVGVGFATS